MNKLGLEKFPAQLIYSLSLGCFYFFFCAVLGAIFSYWSVYLNALNYSATDIAKMGSIFLAANIIATNLWGLACQYFNNPTRVIRVALFLAICTFAMQFIFVQETPNRTLFYIHLTLYGLFSGCFMGISAQTEVVVVNGLKEGLKDYGRIRVWGSVGFIASAAITGILIKYLSPGVLPSLILFFVVLTFLSSLWFPNVSKQETLAASCDNQNRLEIDYSIFRNFFTWLFFIAVALLNFSLGGYYTFFSLFLEAKGYSELSISLFWGVSIAGEIALFFVLKKFITPKNLEALLIISLAFTCIRWLLIAYTPNNSWLVGLAQSFHAFSFALAHTACIGLIGAIFTKKYQSQGMSFYSAFLVNGSAALGALVCGYFWQVKMQDVFILGAATAFLGTSLMLVYCFSKNLNKYSLKR